MESCLIHFDLLPFFIFSFNKCFAYFLHGSHYQAAAQKLRGNAGSSVTQCNKISTWRVKVYIPVRAVEVCRITGRAEPGPSSRYLSNKEVQSLASIAASFYSVQGRGWTSEQKDF